MKAKLVLLLALSLMSAAVFGQRKIWYTTNGTDGSIFSLADVEMDGRTVSPILRWSPVFNFGTNINWNFAQSAGIFAGYNVRNVGMITRDSVGSSDKFKRRVYMVGFPVGLKLGNMTKDQFVFAGGELGFPFHYKQKYFPDGVRKDKIRTREWFSDRTPAMTTAVFVGFHINKHMSIKAQYFLSNFFNPDYTELNAQGVPVKPYANYRSNIYFVTFGYDFSVKEIWAKDKQEEKVIKEKGLFGD